MDEGGLTARWRTRVAENREGLGWEVSALARTLGRVPGS